jgi:hypothetical protein
MSDIHPAEPLPPETRDDLAAQLCEAQTANRVLRRTVAEQEKLIADLRNNSAATVTRLKGVIGQMACRLSENYIGVFDAADIEHGLKDCRVDVEPDVIRVSNLGS